MTEKSFCKRRRSVAASHKRRLEEGFIVRVVKARGCLHRPPGALVVKGLKMLRWLFCRESRRAVDSVAADLNRDRKAMLSQGLNPWYISLCLGWGALRSIVPFLWNMFMALLKNLAGAADWIRKIIGSK